MNRKVKTALTAVVAVIVIIALSFALWVFAIYPYFVADKENSAETGTPFNPSEIAKELDNVEFDKDTGVLYVKNEILVYAKDGVNKERIEKLAGSLGAECDSAMADIGLYKFTFEGSMRLEEIDALVAKIKGDAAVENAYSNPLIVQEPDKTSADSESDDDDEFTMLPSRFPPDLWNNADWSTDVPRNENWGMEAIRAPQAWGYLDKMSEVRIGLIDTLPDINHPDLKDRIAKTTCIFIDDSTGEISNNCFNISPDEHGTHVAGIMNAQWSDDKEGVSGVMDDHASLYYAETYYVSGGGNVRMDYATAYTYLLALKTLIDDDVQVINISQNTSRLISFAASRRNQNAINYLTLQAASIGPGLSRIIAERQEADEPDFVICVAAGNANNTTFYKDANETYGWSTSANNNAGESGDVQAKYNNFLNLIEEESVKDRIIVVGAVEINSSKSTSDRTFYRYTDYSDIGDRVDVVAPGSNIYSTYYNPSDPQEKYQSLGGTSMATPHVSGVAGLIFACNPALSGSDVKTIITATASGRYYYKDGYSGLLNAEEAVISALKTRDSSVRRVLNTSSEGLDLCFVVDTTGSMGDDIDNARENMRDILGQLAAKTQDYRVAIVDYRDYASRTGSSEDYPSRLHLDFTEVNDQIVEGIDSLDLGHGGDSPETVYSGLMEAVSLDWRVDAKKVIILLGDAPPLDPEPVTDYTYRDVMTSLYNAKISYDAEHSDERVLSSPEDSLINVYTIGADASSSAKDFFSDLAESTGGMYSDVDDASEVSGAISDSIEQIVIEPTNSVRLKFNEAYAEKTIDLYTRKGDYLFSFTTNDNAEFKLAKMKLDKYTWKCPDLYSSGSFIVSEDKTVKATASQEYWFTNLQKAWDMNSIRFLLLSCLAAAVIIAVPIVVAAVAKKLRKKRAKTH